MCTKKVHHSTLLALPNTVWGIVVGLGGNAILENGRDASVHA